MRRSRFSRPRHTKVEPRRTSTTIRSRSRRREVVDGQNENGPAVYRSADTCPTDPPAPHELRQKRSVVVFLRQAIPPFSTLWLLSLRLSSPTSCAAQPTSATTSSEDAVQ